jgi:CHRD domain
MRRTMAVSAVALAAAAAVAVPAVANASSPSARIAIVRLSGAQEVNGGDANGSALFIMVAGQQQLCYALITRNLSSPPIASHIHVAPAGTNGPISIALGTPAAANSAESACIQVQADSVQTTANSTMVLTQTEESTIIATPAGFYANVHTQALPGGAIRAQLHH